MVKKYIFITDAQARAGAENYLVSLLSFDGRSNHIIVVADKYTPKSIIDDISTLGITTISGWRYRKFELRSFLKLWWFFIINRGVVICNMTHWESCTWARLAVILSGQKYGQIFHMLNPIPRDRSVRRKVKDWISGFISSFSFFIIAPSMFIKELLVADRRLKGDGIAVIHNGVKDQRADSASSQSSDLALRMKLLGPNVSANTFVLLSLGRLETVKGYKHLIQAVADLPKSSRQEMLVVIAGEGSQHQELANLIVEKGLNKKVELLGYREDVSSLLNISDAFILPSLEENFPLVILEAMSAALPIIASNVGGISEQVTHCRSGLLIPAANVEAIAEAIGKLINSRSLRLDYGLEGRRRYERDFRLETMQQKTWEYIDAQFKKL